MTLPLKVVMAHGGGYFPHYMGRLDRNTANRPDTVRHAGGKTPSAFLRSFYYDSCVYDPQVLKVLIERIADRLVLGSESVGEKARTVAASCRASRRLPAAMRPASLGWLRSMVR
jgi:aminocarboxymuconate-semialdehyde decarboxylase